MSKAQDPGLVTDWNYMFSCLGVLEHTPTISEATDVLGFLVMIAAFIFGIISSRKGEEEF